MRPALSSQGQHKLTAQSKAAEPGRTRGVEPQSCQEGRGAAKPVLSSKSDGKHTARAPAQGLGRAQAAGAQWVRKQAVKPALSSQLQGKVITKGKAPEIRPAQPQSLKEERGVVRPAPMSQFVGKSIAKAPVPKAGGAQAVQSQSIREGRGAEKTLSDGRVPEANKAELSGPHAARPPWIIPKIAIESPSSSEGSLPGKPVYDRSLLMPPPRSFKRQQRSRDRAQKRCVIPTRIAVGCHIPVGKQGWRNRVGGLS